MTRIICLDLSNIQNPFGIADLQVASMTPLIGWYSIVSMRYLLIIAVLFGFIRTFLFLADLIGANLLFFLSVIFLNVIHLKSRHQRALSEELCNIFSSYVSF